MNKLTRPAVKVAERCRAIWFKLNFVLIVYHR